MRRSPFTDVTEKAGLAGAGYSMGVAVGDYDNDGFEDLFVTGLDHTTLYHNNGNGTFTDVTLKSGTAAPGWSTSAGFFDYDNDGKLDLFVCRYVDWSFATNQWCGTPATGRHYCHPLLYNGLTSVLYHNNGDGTFTDVSQKSGIAKLPGRGLGVAFADYDNDGWTDIYVANDSMQSYLYHNNRDGTFTDLGIPAGVTFSNATNESGLARASRVSTGWGVKWLDIDNDGWKDLYAAQGHTDDEMFGPSKILTYRQKPMLLRNDKGLLLPWRGDPGQVFASSWIGRGLAAGDLSASDRRVLAGLGADQSVKSIELRWPSGIVQRLENVKAGQWLTLVEP